MSLPTTTHTEGERMLAHLGKIVLRVFPDVYRFILSKVYPPTPFVCKSLVDNHDDLKTKLSSSEIELLEKVQIGDYSDFTMVLCYKLFIYFKWFDPPKQKWGNEPNESDVELADDIERIRYFFNIICSSSPNYMAKDSYDVAIEKLRNICRRIEKIFEEPELFLKQMELREEMSSEEILSFVNSLNRHDIIPANPFVCDKITLGRNRYAKFGLVVVEMMPKLAREVIGHNIHASALYNLVDKARKKEPSKLDNIITHDERVSVNSLRNGSYEDLDFTTIYKLIRAFILVSEPAQGWGKQPTKNDCEIADDIERLRLKRNCIVHNLRTNISQTTFEEYFSEFLNVAKRVDQYLGKSTGAGFETAVKNYKTCSLDYDLEHKYQQALQKIENMKYRFTEGRITFYYGYSFESFVETVKAELPKHEKRSITIVIASAVNIEEKARLINEMKTEINEGQVDIELESAETGSLILLINVLDVVISSDRFQSVVGNFIERILQLVYSAENLKKEFEVVLIHEEECIEVDCVIEDDDLNACTTEMPVDPESLRIRVNVDTDLFLSKDLLHTELAKFIKKVTEANGIEVKSAILTTRVSEVIESDHRRMSPTIKETANMPPNLRTGINEDTKAVVPIEFWKNVTPLAVILSFAIHFTSRTSTSLEHSKEVTSRQDKESGSNRMATGLQKDDAIWLFETLETIGISALFRRRWKSNATFNEIMGTIGSPGESSLYVFGSTIEGTTDYDTQRRCILSPELLVQI